MVEAINLDRCSTLDVANRTYALTTNVTTNNSVCFTIAAPNITVDCNNFSITVTNDLNVGEIYSIQPDSVIKNCNIPRDTTFDNSGHRAALFDIVSKIVAEPTKVGEDLIVKISLIDFGSSDSVDANLEYTISDGNGMIVRRYNKTVLVTTQTEFLERVNTSELMKGKYTLRIDLKYDGQKFPAYAEKTFNVGVINGFFQNIFQNKKFHRITLFLLTTIMLSIVYVKSRRSKLKEKSELNNQNTPPI